MTRAYVLNEIFDFFTKNQVINAVEKNGTKAIFNGGFSGADTENDFAVVICPVSHEELKDVKAKMRDASFMGLRIVAIFFEEIEEEILGSINALGFSLVSSSSEEIGKIFSGEAVWEDEDGKPRENSSFKRNKC